MRDDIIICVCHGRMLSGLTDKDMLAIHASDLIINQFVSRSQHSELIWIPRQNNYCSSIERYLCMKRYPSRARNHQNVNKNEHQILDSIESRGNKVKSNKTERGWALKGGLPSNDPEVYLYSIN